MPTLRNPRHEKFAQELAVGKTADAIRAPVGAIEASAYPQRCARPALPMETLMHKTFASFLAATTIAVTLFATATDASAQRGWGWGWDGDGGPASLSVPSPVPS